MPTKQSKTTNNVAPNIHFAGIDFVCSVNLASVAFFSEAKSKASSKIQPEKLKFFPGRNIFEKLKISRLLVCFLTC